MHVIQLQMKHRKNKNLLARARDTCNAHITSMYILLNMCVMTKYTNARKTIISKPPGQADAVTDSIKYYCLNQFLKERDSSSQYRL